MRMVPSSIITGQPLDRGAAGALEHVHDARIEFQPRRGFLELSLGVLERVELAC